MCYKHTQLQLFFLFRFGEFKNEEKIHFKFKNEDGEKKLEPEIKRFDKSGELLFPLLPD